MENTSSDWPQDLRRTNPSEYVHLGWPENDTGQVEIINHPPQADGDCPEPPSDSMRYTRQFPGPQVTVNVYGGSTAGGSGTGGSGTGGAATIIRDAVGHPDGPIAALASKLTALSDKVEQLSSQPGGSAVFDSGTWNTMDVRPWNKPQLHTQGRVTFAKKFEAAPTVTVSISSFDVSNQTNSRLKVYATDVDAKGFTAHAEVWYDTTLYSCGACWTATGK